MRIGNKVIKRFAEKGRENDIMEWKVVRSLFFIFFLQAIGTSSGHSFCLISFCFFISPFSTSFSYVSEITNCSFNYFYPRACFCFELVLLVRGFSTISLPPPAVLVYAKNTIGRFPHNQTFTLLPKFSTKCNKILKNCWQKWTEKISSSLFNSLENVIKLSLDGIKPNFQKYTREPTFERWLAKLLP